jgi:hypothetical protein
MVAGRSGSPSWLSQRVTAIRNVVTRMSSGPVTSSPPQRLIPAGRHQPGHLRLIQPQPHERIRGRGQLLRRPYPLADHRDQLLPRISIGSRRAQQLRSPGTRRHPERHQRPVRCDPSRANSCPNFSAGICRGTRRAIFGRYRPARSPANGCIGLWCVFARPRRPRASGNGFTIGPVPASRWKP